MTETTGAVAAALTGPYVPTAGVELPELVTEVPGPISRAVFRRDQGLLAAGNSAGSLWSELAVVEGRGAMIRDADGNWLLDACAGTVVMNLGHGHPAVAEALGEQARRLTHFYDFATQVRVEFVEALKGVLPQSFDAFHLANSGSEAVEAALRTVRSATGRHEVIAFHNAYHGRTLGALSLTTGSRTGGARTAAARSGACGSARPHGIVGTGRSRAHRGVRPASRTHYVTSADRPTRGGLHRAHAGSGRHDPHTGRVPRAAERIL